MNSHRLLSVFFSLIFFITISKPAVADPVDSLKARNYAEHYMANKFKAAKNGRVSVLNLKLVDAPNYIPTLSKSGRVTTNDEKLLYIFNINENDGFVIVSGDDATTPILAYSTDGKFDINTDNPGVKMFLNYYLKTIEYIKKNKISANLEIKNLWEIRNITKQNNLRLSAATLPLKTLWAQGGGKYNLYTPDGADGKSYAGCVAVAMAQIMKYHEYPSKAKGSSDYYSVKSIQEDGKLVFKKENTDFDKNDFLYDWNNMPNQLNENSTSNEKNNVANLIFDCGASVHSKYTVNEQTSAFPTDIVTALTTNFGYSETAKFITQDTLTNNWRLSQIDSFKREIDNFRPFLLGGRYDKDNDNKIDGGHRFVCDGYDIENKFSINWGWGFGNGYYMITNLNPDSKKWGTVGFSLKQSAVIGIQPANGCDFFYPRQRADISSVFWYAPYAQFATQLGLVESINNQFNENKLITLGDAAKSIVLTAKRLNLNGFHEFFNKPCISNNPNSIFFDFLVSKGYLNQSQISGLNSNISFGLLCKLINDVILGSDFPKAYRNGNYTKATVSENAAFKQEILAIINIKGLFEGENGRTKAEYITAGFPNAVITGNETIKNSVLSKFLVNAFVFKFKQNKIPPEIPESNNLQIKEESSDPLDYIVIGDKYEIEYSGNSEVLPPSNVQGTTEYMRSAEVRNFSFPTDELSDGTKVHFYWSAEGANDGMLFEPTATNFQSVKLTAPTVTDEKEYSFYIYLGAENKRAAESYKDIVVRPDNGANNIHLVKGEYFVDTDPGLNLGIPIFDNYTRYGIDKSLEIATNNLAYGTHTLNIRVIDSKGNWSAIKTSTFEVTEPCVLSSATLSGTQTINEGQTANLSITLTGIAPWSIVFNGTTYTANASPFSISVSPSTSTSYNLTSVSNSCGTGTVSGSAVVTINNVCNIPTGMQWQNTTTTSFQPYWNGIAGYNYVMRYRVNGTTNWTETSPIPCTTNGILTTTLSNLASGTNYEWQVKAICGVGNESAYSASTNSITSTATNPCPPTITHGTGVLPAGTYQAGQTISSQANISTSTTYKAGQSILLTNGFQAGPNETFLAMIAGCATAPTNGLVAYYPFNGNANDESGNNYHGTIDGATLANDRKGVASRAFNFNGTNGRIRVEDTPNLNFSSSFSISFWAKINAWGNSNNTAPGIVSKKESDQNVGYVIYNDGFYLDKINFRLKGSSTEDYMPSNTSVTIGSWECWTMVYNSTEGTNKLFRNGVLDKSYSTGNLGNMSSTAPLYFGYSQTWNGYLNGSLDEIRIYNRAITDEEVLQIYNVEKP